MAEKSPITLAGGVKAPGPHAAPPAPAPLPRVSPAHLAFVALKTALVDAIDAEEFLAGPHSHDPACPALADDASRAVDRAMDAAHLAGQAPVLLRSDGPLVLMARLMHCILATNELAERERLQACLAVSLPLLGLDTRGRIGRAAEDLIHVTIDHMGTLCRLLNDPDTGPSNESDAGVIACAA
ncbi:hypothetical protein [Rhodobacter sp. CZR27]|uniref:hypothetical protein n=1 Tax=Rhodobacter sp. CZR27 TaxID=2033869 RepID=UPI000BBE993C|nr:hypothetical protein [Rhodobacter sp. CZR27]